MKKLKIFLLVMFLSVEVFSQQSSPTDSLKNIYKSTPGRGEQVGLLLKIANEAKNPDSILKYSNLAIAGAKAASNDKLLQKAYQLHGVGWRYKADFSKALESLFKSLELAEKLHIDSEIGSINVEVGNVYSESGHNELAEVYYSRGLDVLRKGDDNLLFGKGLFNVADEMLKKGMIDSSFVYTQEAQGIFKDHKDTLAEAYALGNLGMIYAKRGENQKAEKNLSEAIALLEKERDYSPPYL